MKLLVDLFACQTHSRMRGIGRYSLSLTAEMAKIRGNNDLTVLADALYPESMDELRQQFIRLLPPGSFLPYFHEPLKYAPQQNMQAYYKIAETLIEHAYRVVAPDVVLTPSLFDSWADGEQGRVALPDIKSPFQPRAVILYDLIPYIFHELYLDPDPYIHDWYLRRMDLLKKFDFILAISESTRRDAIRILDLDPDRIVNISGAASSDFRKLDLSFGEKQDWLYRLGVSRPFILYIGGNEFRKNMEGALRAFASLPREITSTHQLVLNDVGDEAAFRNKAHALGLADADIVVFKRRTDEELAVLYNLCKLFVFPSLYEGFGLPVLEAMTCGAPVIASNNSSLPEVVGRADALFDASSNQAITDAMYTALTNDPFRADLAANGFARSKQFSWQNTAHRAWDAFESLQGRYHSPNLGAISTSGGQPRIRLAHVSPLPPQKSGVAEYSAALLPYLASHCDIDLFTEPGLQVSDQALRENFAIYPWSDLIARRDEYDAVLYQMGNSELHIPMLDLLKDVPGIVVCHDFFFSNLPFVREIRNNEHGLFQKEMDYSHGLRGVVDYCKSGVESARWEWPLNWGILRNAQEIIVHSEHQNELIQKYFAYGWTPKTTVIKHLRKGEPITLGSEKTVLRKELGLPPDAFIYCSFGFLAPTKMNRQVILAFSHILSKIKGETLLVFVGEVDEESEYGKDLRRILQDLKITSKVRITGYLNKVNYEKYLRSADVAIQLRKDSRGETSGALLDCMAFGLPTVINSHGSFNDYDDNVVLRLSEVPDPQELSNAMIRLNLESAFHKELGQRARDSIINQSDPIKAASIYADVIEKAAGTNETRLFASLVNSLMRLGSPLALVQSSAKYAASHLSLRCQPRILVDTTGLQNIDFREVNAQAASRLIEEFFATNDKAIHIELVYSVEGQWLRAGRLAEKIFDLPKFILGSESPIIVQPGDVLLLIDSSINEPIFTPEIFDIFRQRGGRIVALGGQILQGSVSSRALECDIIICSSPDAAEEVKASICAKQAQLRRSLDIVFPNSVDDDRIKGGVGARNQGLKDQRNGTQGIKAVNLVSLILRVILGGKFRDSISTISIKPGALEMSHQGDQHVLLEVNGGNIGGVSRIISIPHSNGFSIMVDEKASDGISASNQKLTH